MVWDSFLGTLFIEGNLASDLYVKMLELLVVSASLKRN